MTNYQWPLPPLSCPAQPKPAEVSSCAGDAEGGEGHGTLPSSSTYINEIRQVMDVVLEHRGIGGFQGQQILIPRLNCLQSVLCVLCLALKDNKKQNKVLKEASSTLSNTRVHWTNLTLLTQILPFWIPALPGLHNVKCRLINQMCLSIAKLDWKPWDCGMGKIKGGMKGQGGFRMLWPSSSTTREATGLAKGCYRHPTLFQGLNLVLPEPESTKK